MEKLVILNPHKEDFDVDVLRYFVLGNANILLYTLNEHDDDGHVRLYVTKVKDKKTYPLTDEEWTLVKDAIRATVNENKNNLPLSIRDLDFTDLEGMVVENLKIFKLSGDVIDLLGANKKQFPKKEAAMPEIESMNNSKSNDNLEKLFENDDLSTEEESNKAKEETADDFMAEKAIVPNTAYVNPNVSVPKYEPLEDSVDYKILYKDLEKKNKELEEQLENMTLSYQLKYDQIKAILEGKEKLSNLKNDKN